MVRLTIRALARIALTMVPLLVMADHRIRLNDAELALIVGALRARRAGVGLRQAQRLTRLAERLDECAPGNPWLVYGWAADETRDPIAGGLAP